MMSPSALINRTPPPSFLNAEASFRIQTDPLQRQDGSEVNLVLKDKAATGPSPSPRTVAYSHFITSTPAVKS